MNRIGRSVLTFARSGGRVCPGAFVHRGPLMTVSNGGFARLFRSVALALLVLAVAVPSVAQISPKLDPPLSAAASQLTGQSEVVVTAGDGACLDAVPDPIQILGGSLGRRLPS